MSYLSGKLPWYRCTLCDLKTRLSCSDSPATYGSPNMGRFVFVVLELLLFASGSFSLGGGTSRASQGITDMHKVCFSVFSSGDMLCVVVRTTNLLCIKGWCDLKLRYWSVCVGFDI